MNCVVNVMGILSVDLTDYIRFLFYRGFFKESYFSHNVFVFGSPCMGKFASVLFMY